MDVNAIMRELEEALAGCKNFDDYMKFVVRMDELSEGIKNLNFEARQQASNKPYGGHIGQQYKSPNERRKEEMMV